MIFGTFIPQGWKMELAGIADPQDKWAKAVEIAVLAEELGYDSIWVYDHFHNVPGPGARDDVRVLDDAGRDQPAHRRDPPRPDGRLRAVPQPGAAGQDHLEHRRDLAAAASTGASAPAGTSTSTGRTATTSRRRPTASACSRETVEIVKLDVDRARRHLRGPVLQHRRARSAIRSRCSSRTRPSGSAAAASSSRCGSWPGTPTARTSAASPTSGPTSARCSRATATPSGRDYDEITKTWSPEVFIRETEQEIVDAGTRSLLGRAVRVVARGQPRRHPRAGVREDPGLRRPRLRPASCRGSATTPTPRR